MNCSKMEFWHQITPRNPNGDGESGGNEGLVRAIGGVDPSRPTVWFGQWEAPNGEEKRGGVNDSPLSRSRRQKIAVEKQMGPR